LAGATLTIPPLSARREDIPILVDHFVRHFCARWGLPARVANRDVMACLADAPWPGNVRELRNTIQHGVAVSQRRVITRRDLPPRFSAATTDKSETAQFMSLEEVERNQIRRVLALTGQDRQAAARILGLSRSTLYRRLAELRIGG